MASVRASAFGAQAGGREPWLCTGGVFGKDAIPLARDVNYRRMANGVLAGMVGG
jgi:hypothetical protein